ncbi:MULTISPECIES: hypothetical protein [Streptomyces]
MWVMFCPFEVPVATSALPVSYVIVVSGASVATTPQMELSS